MILIIALCLLCGCVAPHACRSVDTRESPSEDLEPFIARHHHEGNIAELLIPLLERSLAQNEVNNERQHRLPKPGKNVIQVLPYRGSEEHKRKGWRKLNSRKKQVVEITPLHGKNRAKPLAYILSAAKPSHGDVEQNEDVNSMSTSDLEQDKFSSEEQQSSEDGRQGFESNEIRVNVRNEADTSSLPSSYSLQSGENLSSKQDRDVSISESEMTKEAKDESKGSGDDTNEIMSRTARRRVVIESADDSIVNPEDVIVETMREDDDISLYRTENDEDTVSAERIDHGTDEDTVVFERADNVAEEDSFSAEKIDNFTEDDTVTAVRTDNVSEEYAVSAESTDNVIEGDDDSTEGTGSIRSEENATIERTGHGNEEDAITAEKTDNGTNEDNDTAKGADNDTKVQDDTVEKTDNVISEDKLPIRSQYKNNNDISKINTLVINPPKETKDSSKSPENTRKSFIANDIVISHGHNSVESAEKTFSKLFNSQARDIIELIQSSVEASTTPHRDCTSDRNEHNNHDHKSYRLSFLFNK